MSNVYTFGYERRKPAEIREEAKRLDAVVIDVRFSPRSRAVGWSLTELKRMLGPQYVHMKALGNLNYRRPHRPWVIVDAAGGIEAVTAFLRTGRNVILLCYEERPETCHRSAIAQQIADHAGCEVEHLLPEHYQLGLFD